MKEETLIFCWYGEGVSTSVASEYVTIIDLITAAVPLSLNDTLLILLSFPQFHTSASSSQSPACPDTTVKSPKFKASNETDLIAASFKPVICILQLVAIFKR
ncbi:hypothetical protein [Prevotella sp.]|uniref:hypothetical protein n=1 Tax=Prevotella sp. TaxID=59823 RepID=UPI0025F4715C